MYQYREPLPVTALILTGGKSSRLGSEDKGLLLFNEQPMIKSTINTLKRQVKDVVICANRNLEQYEQFGLPVITDQVPDFAGPLAGISAGMAYTDNQWLLVTPCDTPMIPDDLAVRLYYSLHRSGADIAYVHDGQHAHYLHSMIRTSLKSDLDQHLAEQKLSVNRWISDHKWLEVDFSDQPEAFFNVNTQEQLEQAEKLVTLPL